MRSKNYHQNFVLPLAVVTSAGAMFATWHLHTLKINSPVLPKREAAMAWANDEARTQRCLRQSIDIQMNKQGFAAITGSEGPYFTTLRCNQTPKIYWRLALLAFIPWAALTFLARLWFGD